MLRSREWRAVALAFSLGALCTSPTVAAPPAPLHLPIQGIARDDADQLIPSGNIAVRIYPDSLGNTPAYDSGTQFNGAIVNGIFDIVVGLSPVVSLDPTLPWFLELDVAGTEVIGNAAGGRSRFYFGGGDRTRADFESRLDALEAAMGFPPQIARSMKASTVQTTAGFSNQHAMIGVSRVAGAAGGFSTTGNLVLQPVGPRTANTVRAELGPHSLSAPGPNPAIRFVSDVAGDQGRSVRIRWRRDLRERAYNPADTQPRITSYTVYRRVDPLPVALASEGGVSAAVAALPAVAREPGADVFALPPGEWDVLTTVPATLDTAYQTVVPTLCDSNVTAFCRATFVVRSITDQVGIYHNSVRDSGYSVDNLAPGVPGNLQVATVPGGAHLTWQASSAPDFQYFRVYRSNDPGFVPGPGTLIQSTASTDFTDPTVGSFTWKVTALDFNGNESVPAVASITTGVDAESPKVLAFAAMSPNPFSHSLRFVIAVPEASGVIELSIFDLAGRRVRTLVHQALAAGRHPFTWDGRNESGGHLGAGIYVARLTGAGRTITRQATLIP